MGGQARPRGLGREVAVVRAAVASRLLVLCAQAVLNALISDYDSSIERPLPGTGPDRWVAMLLGGFTKWDAVYFVRIGGRGYEYEHYHGFFPALPLLLRTVAATVLWPLGGVLSAESQLVVAGVLVTNTAFVLAAVGLYRLGLRVLGDGRLAYRAALLLCISPATVFMSAVYTESVFAAATFWGMYLLTCGAPYRGCLCLALASATRGNGLVNVGFVCYGLLQRLHELWATHTLGPQAVGGALLGALVQGALVLGPFALFQAYGYATHCSPPAPRPWCGQRLPLIYSFVQEHYWHNGLLAYYQAKQLPNFLLALPTLALAATCLLDYARGCPQQLKTLGLAPDHGTGLHRGAVFVYMAYTAALLGFALGFMYIQVTTRFVAAACPPLYWYVASLPRGRGLWLAVLLFLGYSYLGLALHCNFHPWT